MCVHGGSHLGVVDWSSGSKWYFWFLWWCWLQFCRNVVGGWQGICCIFSSGEWMYQGFFVIVDFLRCGQQRWRMSSGWYQQWGWRYWCWCQSGCRSFGWCWSICGWVGVMSLLGSGLNSRCWFTGTQSEQLLFERQDMLFQGELENAHCWVGQYVQQKCG